ncbi:zinc finger BED domain-containing protein RICESLEEPER 2-like [Prosopis cineraria]|uniref:zinc finger BED domain-containing protein RICESLEEPER 2-like n=1 Tax=Prosopis cineraria TaxID=364024 RepID=UPI0024105A5B|nr:zinc finger BED domain-containing protein RICESLEEPER 2-like [Prosopis cineraria]
MATTPTLQENVETKNASSPNNTEEENESKNEGESRRKRHKSAVWAHFERLPLDKTNGEPRAKCKYCPMTIGCDSTRHGTNGMRKHVKRYPRNPNKANKLAQSLLSGSQLGSSKTFSHHLFNQLDCRQAIAIFVILDEMPFNVVEGDGFKEMMRRLEPRFQVPSRATVTRDCYKLYLEEARKLKRYFKKSQIRVSLTTDTWTSNQNASYMCLTAHWIDEHWTYQKQILNFCVVENHKGETIAQEIKKCLLFWSIDKVFTITVDNASSNDTALASLKGVLRHWNGLVCDGEFLHLRCCAHILNLIVSDGVKDMHKCIEGIRNAIKYVRSSPSRFHKFKELVEKMKIDSRRLLSMDCPTRWNSTYIMLESAIKFYSVFERMEQQDNDYRNFFLDKNLIGPPNENDWKDAKDFVIFLKVFYDITLQFSGSLYVTSNVCFQQIVDVFAVLYESANNHDSLLCVVLDPRYKMKYLQFAFEDMFPEATQREAMTKKVSDVLYRLYDHYSSGVDTSQTQSQSQSQTQGASESSLTQSLGSDRRPLTFLSSRSKASFQRFLAQKETEIQADKYAEVDKYLHDELAEALDPNFDILTWWKLNSAKYKVLSLIARDVLAMPVSTVSSESTFSTGGRVIDDSRSSLSPKMVEALICAQNWLSPSTAKLKGVDVDDFNDTEQAVEGNLGISKSILFLEFFFYMTKHILMGKMAASLIETTLYEEGQEKVAGKEFEVMENMGRIQVPFKWKQYELEDCNNLVDVHSGRPGPVPIPSRLLSGQDNFRDGTGHGTNFESRSFFGTGHRTRVFRSRPVP